MTNKNDDMNLELDAYIKKQFDVPPVDVRTYSPLALAYIGDGIFDIVIRTVVVGRGNTKPNSLHQKTSKIVKAETQAKLAEALAEDFTEEEMSVYKRGRNAKSFTTAKNASVSDYRKATGFEAVVGYLYLTERFERVLELTKIGLQRLDISI